MGWGEHGEAAVLESILGRENQLWRIQCYRIESMMSSTFPPGLSRCRQHDSRSAVFIQVPRTWTVTVDEGLAWEKRG